MRRRGFSKLFLVTRQETARKGESTNGLRCAPYAVYTLLCAAVYFQFIVKVRCKLLSAVNFHRSAVTLLSSRFHAGAELSTSRELSAWLKPFIHLIHGAVRFHRLRTCQRTQIAWVCSIFTVAHNVWHMSSGGFRSESLSTEAETTIGVLHLATHKTRHYLYAVLAVRALFR